MGAGYAPAVDAQGDLRVRLAAFEWLGEQVELHGDVLPRALLEQGFVFEGQRVPLVGPQGIFKPRVCELPLSITTIPGGQYQDKMSGPDLRYSYRGTDTQHPDNVGLRQAMSRRVPLVLFVRLKPGRYLAHHPVFIVGDDPGRLVFEVDVERRLGALGEPQLRASEDAGAIERRYVISAFRRRVHQRQFRERVLEAYREQCTICHLRHQELLDAAHIVADSEDDCAADAESALVRVGSLSMIAASNSSASKPRLPPFWDFDFPFEFFGAYGLRLDLRSLCFNLLGLLPDLCVTLSELLF